LFCVGKSAGRGLGVSAAPARLMLLALEGAALFARIRASCAGWDRLAGAGLGESNGSARLMLLAALAAPALVGPLRMDGGMA
jgi:hypothetical protein